jgi:hypothetical protein
MTKARKLTQDQKDRRIAELEAALKAAGASFISHGWGEKYVAFPLDAYHERCLLDHYKDRDEVPNAPFNSEQVGVIGEDNESLWDMIVDEDSPPGLDAVVLRVSYTRTDGSHLCRVFGAKRIS